MKEKVFGGAPGPTTIVMKLRETNSQIAKFAALLLKGHEDDFGERLMRGLLLMQMRSLNQDRCFLCPSELVRAHEPEAGYAHSLISLPQSNLDPVTTSGLENLVIGATASGSGQVTAPGPSQAVARGYSLTQHELDYGMRPMERQPSSYPSQHGQPEAQYDEDYDTADWRIERPEITGSQGQDKGKGKALETSSGSSGDFEFREFVNDEDDEPQDPEPQDPETPDKGKGKQKRQQSSSESPPKGKESKKPPAPEKKKQRRGGGKS